MLNNNYVRMKLCFAWWIWILASFYSSSSHSDPTIITHNTRSYFVNAFQYHHTPYNVPTKYLSRSEWKSLIITSDSRNSCCRTNRKTITTSASPLTVMTMMIDPDIVWQLPTISVGETIATSSFVGVLSSFSLLMTSIQTFVSSTINIGVMDSLVSPEPIHTAFSIATFLPQPFWVLMVLFPNSSITKRCMTGYQIPLLCSAVHLLIVVASILANGSETTAPLSEFNDVFDISGDPQRAFFHMTSSYPDFVAEEWSHVLTWDLFVGRYIWYDSIQKKINASIPVLFCNLIGPPALFMYWITCQLNGQPFLSDGENLE